MTKKGGERARWVGVLICGATALVGLVGAVVVDLAGGSAWLAVGLVTTAGGATALTASLASGKTIGAPEIEASKKIALPAPRDNR